MSRYKSIACTCSFFTTTVVNVNMKLFYIYKRACQSLLLMFIAPVSSFGQIQNGTPNMIACKNLIKEATVENYKEIIAKADSLLGSDTSSGYERGFAILYSDIADVAGHYGDQELTLFYKIKSIRMGFSHIMCLENPSAYFLKTMYPDYYKLIETLSDSVYFQRNSAMKGVNMNLAFTLRHMTRLDQRIRTYDIINRKALKSNHDSIIQEMRKIDYANEAMLGLIFETYGYPGLSLVGEDFNAASLLMQHMSIDFQVKYIHLLTEAVEHGELYENLQFLIDKILYRKYKISIYGTHYDKNSLITEPEELDRYLNLLQIKNGDTK